MVDQGKKVAGCFPLYPPLELLHSLGLLPVVLWGLDSADLAESDRRLQNFTCSVGRRLCQFVLSDAGPGLDMLFAYNACDTLRNLPEILQSGLEETGRPLPVFHVHIPMTPPGQTNVGRFLGKNLGILIRQLEEFSGADFSEENFVKSAALYNKARDLAGRLEKACSRGQISFADFSVLIMEGAFLPVEEHVKNMAGRLERLNGAHAVAGGKPVVLSGILPPPGLVITAMERAGLRVAANDIASLSRTYAYSPGSFSDVFSYYTDFYYNHFPCTTLLYCSDSRVERILSIVEKSGAMGFIICGVKYCEYEYFEIPHLTKRLKEKSIPTLHLEFSVNDRDHVRGFTTRIEAFAEMLN